MGSHLGVILANIFMDDFERSVMSGVANKMKNWGRYVDDTICHIKLDPIDYVLSNLNNFHKSIQFTVELRRKVEYHS